MTVFPSAADGQTPTEACPRLPRISPQNIAELTADFKQYQGAPIHLRRLFSISKPYVLLSPKQAEDFQKGRFGVGAVNSYAGSEDLIRFSRVFFNRRKTAAMVHMSAWCGGLCGLWGWHVLVKTDAGVWRVDETARCSAAIS